MVIQKGRNSGRVATLLPIASAAVSLTTHGHEYVSIESTLVNNFMRKEGSSLEKTLGGVKRTGRKWYIR